MQKPQALHQTAWRRRAALWSIPVLAAALGLSSPGAQAQMQTQDQIVDFNRGLDTPPAPGLGTPGTGIGGYTGADTWGVDAAGGMAGMPDMRASNLIGMDVRNRQGESLGEIEDLVMDVNNQRVHYAVLSFGGFLDMGDKLFAYPLRVFQMGREGEELVLNVDQERLERWPGFERNRWPNWQDERYLGEIERAASGPAVQVVPQPNMQLIRASTLMGKDVNDRYGNDAGEIEDVVVNLRNGAVHYVVMDFDQAWNPNDLLLAMPLTAFDFPARNDIDLRLNIDRDRLDMRAGFEADRWPNLNDPAWMTANERWLSRAGNELERETRDAIRTPLYDSTER